MVYGGTIRAGSCEGQPQLDVVDAFQAYGKYLQDGQTPSAEAERYRTVRYSCPGPGACGGACFFCVSSYFYPAIDKMNRCTRRIRWPVLQKCWV
jgi:hypothetical protein